MLSGALGLQIIVRRLGVELGEQQFSKINGIDERELTFKEIKAIASEHSVICRAVKSNLDGLGIALEKQPVLAFLKNGPFFRNARTGCFSSAMPLSLIHISEPTRPY